MAKSVEDTAFYRYHQLISLNEVGGMPERFGVSLAAFHEQNRERLAQWPYSMLATTTHDTKRSEDVRARINVLSEIPQEWQAALRRWSTRNKKKKLLVDGQPAPDCNDEYLLYQTLLGVWPLTAMTADEYTVFKQRIQNYMRKAAKEAKVNTSWINPHEAYDDAVQQFVGTVLDDCLLSEDFQEFCHKVAQYGLYNSLSQTLLKLTAPGVPDIYQGNELWDFSLVDPDNRRPVDYDYRRQLLHALQARLRAAGPDLRSFAQELLDTWSDGRIKLYVIHQTLRYRREHSEVFFAGEYVPLEGIGAGQKHLCAFARRHARHTVLVAAPRFLTRLVPHLFTMPLGSPVWRDSWLALPVTAGNLRYRNLFTDEFVTPVHREGQALLALEEVFATFPIALLAAED